MTKFIAGFAVGWFMLMVTAFIVTDGKKSTPVPVAQDRVFGVKHLVEIPGSNGREWHVRLRLMEPDTTGKEG